MSHDREQNHTLSRAAGLHKDDSEGFMTRYWHRSMKMQRVQDIIALIIVCVIVGRAIALVILVGPAKVQERDGGKVGENYGSCWVEGLFLPEREIVNRLWG